MKLVTSLYLLVTSGTVVIRFTAPIQFHPKGNVFKTPGIKLQCKVLQHCHQKSIVINKFCVGIWCEGQRDLQLRAYCEKLKYENEICESTMMNIRCHKIYRTNQNVLRKRTDKERKRDKRNVNQMDNSM